MLKLVIMQGIPGSGKTFVRKRDYLGAFVASADNYFRELDTNYDKDGSGFDATKLSNAHRRSFSDCKYAMDKRFKLIVVDNTNLENAAISPYVSLADYYGYKVEICRVHCDPQLAYSRNTHGVEQDAYEYLHKAFIDWRLWRPHRFLGVKVRNVNGDE